MFGFDKIVEKVLSSQTEEDSVTEEFTRPVDPKADGADYYVLWFDHEGLIMASLEEVMVYRGPFSEAGADEYMYSKTKAGSTYMKVRVCGTVCAKAVTIREKC